MNSSIGISKGVLFTVNSSIGFSEGGRKKLISEES